MSFYGLTFGTWEPVYAYYDTQISFLRKIEINIAGRTIGGGGDSAPLITWTDYRYDWPTPDRLRVALSRGPLVGQRACRKLVKCKQKCSCCNGNKKETREVEWIPRENFFTVQLIIFQFRAGHVNHIHLRRTAQRIYALKKRENQRVKRI